MGQTSSNGADGAGFNSAASGQQAGYSMAHDSFGQAGGYPQQAAFGAFSPQQAAMATPQVDPPDSVSLCTTITLMQPYAS